MKIESKFKNRDWNESKILNLIMKPTTYLCFAAEDNMYVGFALGYITDQYFGNDLVANDLAFYVRPEYRKMGAASMLIKDFEKWAINMGAKEIYLGQSTGVDVEQTRQLFSHLGYEIVGCITKKEF